VNKVKGSTTTKTQVEHRNNNIARYAIYDRLDLAAIGRKYDLTRERVRQILKQLGIDYHVVLLREQNRQKAYKESLKAASAYYATTLPNGKQRPEYRVYANMLRRCLCATCPQYKRYGGRGISVCDKWRGDYGFESFLLDMGSRPEGKYPSGRAKFSIHRINNDGDYEPDNCKWAPGKEQCANRSKPQRKEKVEAPVMPGVFDTGTTGHQAYL
jgi:hypothetical protein